MIKRKIKNSIIFFSRAALLVLALSFSLVAQGKNPVILIPGMTGSELRQKDTGERVWFKAFKSKKDDLRLPILADPTKMHDDLIATDVMRSIKIAAFPVYDVYGEFIKAMEIRGGYREENWDTPSEDGYKDSIYVFAYDWRLDNVGNARLLVQKIEALKLKLKKPGLKFDIVAHSMGGLLSRYAAMYGDADLPAGDAKPVPTWAGAALFDKIVLLGTPNEGSVLSLNALVNGYSIGNVRVDLPYVQDSSRFLVFTIPTAFELLPAPGTIKVLDDKLEPIYVDLYDPKIWTKYGWNPIDDKDFPSRFDVAERKVAPAYFAAALDRARRLHEALAAADGKTGGVTFYVVGSDCKTALDAIVIYHDNGGKWKTAFTPNGFKRTDGVRITDAEMRKAMFAPGDGIVTRRSLEAVTESEKIGVPSVFSAADDKFICESHNKLAGNLKIQDHIIGLLNKKKEAPVDNVADKEEVHK